jgi:type I site-specific restriction-modification system R (restriction) subunit
MIGRTDDVLVPTHAATEASVPVADGTSWLLGDPTHYDRDYCIDLVQLRGFLMATQPDALDSLALEVDGPTRRKFLARLQGEISRRGTIDVLRHGLKHGPHHLDLFCGTPSPGNPTAIERFAVNRFSVSRQLRYSRDKTQRALDLGLFINGLPVASFELKNSLTKQTVADAVKLHQLDRDPREKLFEFGRCVAHFALDDHEVRFCTQLKGKASWFLPFNNSWNDGAGNPPNPEGLKTAYLWQQILTREGLPDILENYAQVVETKDEKTGKKKAVQIWPRYHQLEGVRRLLADAAAHGAGRRYLIQHSAGSGKSNSIAWLAHQLIGLERNGTTVFDSILVVTDRPILDQQIRDTIRQFAQVGAMLSARATCVAVYQEQLDEDGQVHFKGKAKAFSRTYGFLSSILPYTNADWEKLSILLNVLISKLPAPIEEDLSAGILEAIDMDSYRVEKQAAVRIQLPDKDAEIEPVPAAGAWRTPEPELDRLSTILKVFHDQFGNIEWTDEDRVNRLITEDIPRRVSADPAYQNARQNSDKQNARIEHDKALTRVMTDVLKDDMELFKQFMDDESFRHWMADTVFGLTYE